MDKLLALRFALRCVGAGRTVGQFDESDNVQGNLNFSCCARDGGELCRTFWPCRSAVISTLESRISPMRAVRAVRDGSR